MYNYKLKSHSAPNKTLFRHLKIVGDFCKNDILSFKTISSKEFDIDLLSYIGYIIGVTHDLGKSTSYFQNMLVDKTKRSVYSNHSAISSLFTYYVCSQLFSHYKELASLAFLTVRRHHSHLKTVHGVEDNVDFFDFGVFQKQIKDIKSTHSDGFNALDELRLIYQVLIPQINIDTFFAMNLEDLVNEITRALRITIRKSNDFKNYFILLIFYSALQEADKSDASGIYPPARKSQINSKIVENYRARKFNLSKNQKENVYNSDKPSSYRQINILRNMVYKDITESLKKKI